MRIGVVFPQTELGGDVGAVRAYGEAVEELGFTHLLAYDHVRRRRPGGARAAGPAPTTCTTTFHEPFVMFGYLAAVTSLELVTGIIILPQRQTALVAKQAAEVDLLTEGRFRLGVGVGWNAVEYEALGKDFADRGRGSTSRSSCCAGCGPSRPSPTTARYEHGHRRRPGARCRCSARSRSGSAARRRAAYRRIGRLADGWFPQVAPGPEARRGAGHRRRGGHRGRPRSRRIGMEGRVSWGAGGVERPGQSTPSAGGTPGATHLAINTMGAGLATVDAHLEALAVAAQALGVKM